MFTKDPLKYRTFFSIFRGVGGRKQLSDIWGHQFNISKQSTFRRHHITNYKLSQIVTPFRHFYSFNCPRERLNSRENLNQGDLPPHQHANA